VLVASSDKAYGDHETLPYDESTPLQGRHPYDVSKSCADLISLAYFETYRLPVCVARCGNLFGPGDLNFNRLIPGTIRSVLQGLPVLIRSDGLAVRDYLYVRDAAVAYVDLAQQMISDGISGEPFNFSNELQLGVLDVVNEIARVLEVDIEPTVLNEATGEIRHQYLSAAKARTWLGWKPRFSLEQGLRETAEWYRDGSLPPL
jgi:CDP-glucose 4,6-dehydratase